MKYKKMNYHCVQVVLELIVLLKLRVQIIFNLVGQNIYFLFPQTHLIFFPYPLLKNKS